MKFKRVLIPFLVTLAITLGTVGVVYAATSTINGTTYTHPSWYNSSTYKVFHGIDVSYWQGAAAKGSDVNWTKVKRAGVDYAFIRCGYSPSSTTTHGDSTCDYNVTNAYAAGVSVGLYYYSEAKTTAQAIKEAKYAISIANNYPGVVTMPIIMDYELNLGTKTTMTKCAVAFCDTVKAAGYTPMVYSYYNLSYSKLDFSKLGSYKFWLAHYSTSTGFEYPFEFWQYTSSGSVSGIIGRVDRNFWYYNNSAATTTAGTTSIKDCDISLSYSSVLYSGKKKEPAVTVTNGGTTLAKGTDYVTMYFNNVKSGTSYVIVKGIGNYSNEALKKFKIIKEYVDISTGTVSSISNMEYTGDAIKPSPTVKYGSTTLKKNTDYTLSYSNNENVGTATITITGTGIYKGTLKQTFKIVKADAKIETDQELYKTAINSNVVIIDTDTTGGTLTYSSSDTSLVTVNEDGELSTGSKTGTATITIKSAATSNTNATTATVTVKVYSRPSKVNATKITKPVKNYFKLYWKTTTKTTGYLIKYSNSSSFKTYKFYRVKSSTDSSKVLKDSLSGSYAYVKIKAYRTLDDVYYYGPYSNVMKIKVR